MAQLIEGKEKRYFMNLLFSYERIQSTIISYVFTIFEVFRWILLQYSEEMK